MRARARRAIRRSPYPGLTAAEAQWLLRGTVDYGIEPPRWLRRDDDGEATVEEAQARALWGEHRGDLIADAAADQWHCHECGRIGLIPYAARLFDNAVGHVRPYEHLTPSVTSDHTST